ncbi:MAG: ABC transporter transmembrane domain-containing protein [Pseudomonadota bacterium]
MPPSLFEYAWQHSRRDQFILLAITLASFPVLYLTLEIPKQIVNDAIGGTNFPATILGFSFTQLEYLAILCAMFLTAVIVSGLVKMQLNTMKGVLAERLLRRFRYELIARAHRFPLTRFRQTSQGELVSMVTAEAEPLGGIMGNLIAHPLFQAGQMLTILLFLLIQNVWFAIAAVALIPVQAYLIPRLQRRINLLNKSRIQQVRHLAEQIGESVGGMPDLRANNGTPFALAQFSSSLHTLFQIRFRIYRIKFFMKFLNNFINQLTPFFFFAIGGYLVIQGQLTLGALVAALAAFKDLSAPWKELLTFYNQFQDMSLRYHTVIEQFDPPGMIPAPLIEGRATETPSLRGPIVMHNVTVTGNDNHPVLDRISVEIPAGAMVAVQCPNAMERLAFAQALSRTVLLRSGQISIAGHDLGNLHQEAIGRRIGVVNDLPYLLSGTIGQNLTAPLRIAPRDEESWPDATRRLAEEAAAVGNSTDPVDVPWLDPTIAGVNTREELRSWWLSIVETMGTDDFLVHRALDARVDPSDNRELTDAIVKLRPDITHRLAEHGLLENIIRFDATQFHPGLALAENVLHAVPRNPAHAEVIVEDPGFRDVINRLGIQDELRATAMDILRVLMRTFGEIGTDHPMFNRLPIDAETYATLADAFRNHRGVTHRDPHVETLLLTLPFLITAETLPEAITDRIRARALEIRQTSSADLLAAAEDLFVPLSPNAYAPGLTLLENALYGKVALGSAHVEAIRELAIEVIVEAGLKADAAITIANLQTGLGGSALPPIARERIAFVRAVIKRPDVLILDRALASHDERNRQQTRDRLRTLLPDTTILFIEPAFTETASFDMVLEIEDGRIAGQVSTADEAADGRASAELDKKIRLLRNTALFRDLPRAQTRLLAFASDWVKRPMGAVVFKQGDPTDGAYLMVKGKAELRWPNAQPGDEPLMDVEPGRVIGDLSVIMQTPRTIDLVATTDIIALRIRKDELLEIIRNDATVAAILLETVSGYLMEAAEETGRLQRAE